MAAFFVSLLALSLHGVVGVSAQSESQQSSSSSATQSTATLSASETQSQQSALTFTNSLVTLDPLVTTLIPNITYSSGQQIVNSPTSSPPASDSLSPNGTASASGSSSMATEEPLTTIIGGRPEEPSSGSLDATASATDSAPEPVNTIPCNNHPEFCDRKYSNITEVTSHNSAFSVSNNAASNQEYPISVQLNDGVRGIQGQSHLINGTMYSCHTSCDLLNVGTYTSVLDEVADWVERHPYDVVTVFVGNSGWPDGVTALDYRETFQNSKIFPFLYEPQYVPQRREQWPTLGEIIISGKRVVAFIDYNANQTEVPYLLDQYSHFWSTPFSPTNQSFPCTLQLPLELDDETAKEDFMYIANHNLNVNVEIADASLLIPDTYNIEQTNGRFDRFGQLGAMVSNCTAKWGLPPTSLVVDYYNRGNPGPGSVFEVAAAANNVTYDIDCCGTTSAAVPANSPVPVWSLLASVMAIVAVFTV
ncbi:hypothetical protein MBLNU230_g6672t1 [Neophaeotheca triangularis]